MLGGEGAMMTATLNDVTKQKPAESSAEQQAATESDRARGNSRSWCGVGPVARTHGVRAWAVVAGRASIASCPSAVPYIAVACQRLQAAQDDVPSHQLEPPP
jgi:hypothetical protein